MNDLGLEDFLRAARSFHAPTMLEGEAYRNAPETRRYGEAWEAALARHDEWQALVRKMQSELPDTTIGDTTAPYAIAAQRCCVYMTRLENAERNKPYSIIVALASVLVPYYHIYQIVADDRAGALAHGPPLPRPRKDAEGTVSDIVARHLEQELGLKEFPSEYEAIRVPDIVVGNLLPGQATLVGALFDTDRGNIP